jgi:hypothetical protein
MKSLLAVAFSAVALSGGLLAVAPATIQTKDGKSYAAYTVESDSVTGLNWKVDRTNYGRPTLRPWEIEAVRYTNMDEFNSLPRKMAGGLFEALLKDAEFVLKSETRAGFTRDEMDNNIRHSCRYYIAQAHRIRGDHKKAIEAFETFLTECEKTPFKGVGGLVRYTSPITGKPVQDASGLHRLYLSGLEAYNDSLLREGKVEDSKNKAIKALNDLTRELQQRGSSEYLNWTMRALRTSATYAEGQKDYSSARQYYEKLLDVALFAGDSKPTRASMEAQLKVGFMRVKEGDRSAGASFITAIRRWEDAHSGRARAGQGWVNSDEAYLTSGSYVGQGLHEAAGAKSAAEWTVALKNFSMALAIFHTDDEIRSMALIGAAQASAKLAELAKSNPVAASANAKLAEKYLAELQNLYPKTRAASDEAIPAIQKIITTYKKDE